MFQRDNERSQGYHLDLLWLLIDYRNYKLQQRFNRKVAKKQYPLFMLYFIFLWFCLFFLLFLDKSLLRIEHSLLFLRTVCPPFFVYTHLFSLYPRFASVSGQNPIQDIQNGMLSMYSNSFSEMEDFIHYTNPLLVTPVKTFQKCQLCLLIVTLLCA